MFATLTSGAATRPMKKTYITRSPVVIRPLVTSRPPTMISSVPMTPITAVESAAVALVPVIVFAMLRKRRCTPSWKMRCSRSSAV